MDINKIIFSRMAAAKKMEIIKYLQQYQLLTITQDSIFRIIKTSGTRQYKSRNKHLWLHAFLSNEWNAWLKGVRTFKGKLLIDVYVQYENTDTDTSIGLDDFLNPGEYQGSIIRPDRHGNNRHYYFYFTESEKAEFIRALLLTYLRLKYNLD